MNDACIDNQTEEISIWQLPAELRLSAVRNRLLNEVLESFKGLLHFSFKNDESQTQVFRARRVNNAG